MLWLRKQSKNIILEDSFVPKIYVEYFDLKGLQQKLSLMKIKSRLVRKHTFSKRNLWVLEVFIENISRQYPIARLIEKLTNYKAVLYNVDQKSEENYMFSTGIFPLAKVDVFFDNGKVKSIRVLDKAEDVNYKMPDFNVAKLGVKTADNLFKGFDTKLKAILFNDDIIKETEKKILLEFKKKFENLDPDVLWTGNGNLIIPFLKEKFKFYGIKFNFNRFCEDDFVFSKGDYYHSYSRVVYRTGSIFLKGRLHFDKRSFFANDTGFYGIIDGARVCHQRIQRTAMRSSGAAVTNFLLYIAFKKNYLLPYKVGIYERFKTMYELYQADRGSMIFEPRIGFHTDVVELDFTSLYPNIMNKYNLSPETLFCKCCRWNKLPGLHYHYCTRVRGIVPEVAKVLISRRIELKKNLTPANKEKVDYIKWLLVTMFGYQAFKNKKIGCIENHEAIQAIARETIFKTTRVAESLGWEVVHGIIDSVYIKKKGFFKQDVEHLGREIFLETELELDHEGNYRWIVFLPSILNPVMPVSSHFYGVFEDGKIKCRGIEARRKDSPEIVATMQREMIERLAEARDFETFKSLFPAVFKILKNYVANLPYATAKDLRIVRTLSKTDYKNDIAQKVIVKQMIDEGYDVQPGQTIAYIIRDVFHPEPLKRYVTLDSFDGRFDIAKYTDLMVRSVFNILQPFGVTIEGLYEMIRGERQKGLVEYV